MLPVLYGPSLIRKMLGSCLGLHVHKISQQHKMSASWLTSDWFVTIPQLRLTSCGIVFKAVWASVPVHAIQSLTQCPGV
ncbi:hypothetical protein TNCV_2140391 [Trichonephila clavipes]|uniref:Uncharacterized protein n=1 Tax=Trichonephila clavipes TaxID=2585209 RepID=A0A8X6RXB9_TRICX|nr:hypothetical protein TNCV_2140391 [Trichonephila clavipes]